MKILLTGFLLLALWTVVSTFLYITEIKDFSMPVQTMQAEPVVAPPAPKAIMPEKLLIYYDSDKTAFTTDELTEKQLYLYRNWINENPNSRISVTGHTDASGSNAYNMDLGNKRALSIQNYLVGKGMPQDKVITSSKGEEEPIGENATPEGKAKNRRSEITIK